MSLPAYSRILGTGSYLPERRVSNADLAAQLAADGVETSDAWIQERTGIQARYFAAPNQCSSDLALPAAQAALQAAGVEAADIDAKKDGIALVTNSMYFVPLASSSLIAARVWASEPST